MVAIDAMELWVGLREIYQAKNKKIRKKIFKKVLHKPMKEVAEDVVWYRHSYIPN